MPEVERSKSNIKEGRGNADVVLAVTVAEASPMYLRKRPECFSTVLLSPATGHGCTADIHYLLHVVVQGQGVSEVGQFFSVTYGCGATGRQSCPIFGFLPIFPIQNP